MKVMSLSEARNNLLRIAEAIRRDPSHVIEVTKHGKRVMAIMSSEIYESILETLDILGDEDALRRPGKALREVREGKSIPWKGAKQRLGLPE